MKEFLKKNRAYIASSLIAISILLVVYFLKGIYPFGQNSIVEADLGQAYIPVFYNVYDIFHSGNSIFWNFCLGAGSNFYGSFVLNALFSPFTLLFGLVARPRIIDYVNILLIIKVVFLGITSIYAYKKIFPKTKEYWYVIFGLLYELSAYICLSYHNIVWLDSLIVFPLFVLSLKKLLDTGDARWYTVTLAIELVLSYYISYMILMAIVFIGTLGAFLYTKKSLRKKVCMKILLCTLVALAISSFAFLPSFTQSSISMRLSNVTTNSSLSNPEIYTKLNFYMFASIPIIFYIINIYQKYRKDKKIAWFWILAFIFVFLGVLIEPINKMWHTGSYSSFPYRYGFIPLFLLNLGALSYLNNAKEKDRTLNRLDIIFSIFSSILLVGAITLVIIFAPDITTHQIFIGLYDSKMFLSIFIVSLVITLGLILAISIGSKKIRLTLIYAFTILQILSCTYFFIGMDNEYITGADHKDEVIKLENKIAEEMDLPRENRIDRFKDTTSTFEENYAYILNVPTISSWIHIITQDQADLHKALGYSTRYTRVQDLGGTLFSDSLFHIKYLFTDSNEKLFDKIYELKETYGSFNLYEKDVIPFGILNNGARLDDYDDDTFEYQNMLYKKLFGEDEDIIHTAKPKVKINGDEVTLTFKLPSENE